MIGSGIFIVPAAIAWQLGASVPIILVWTIGGLVSLFGALSVAELGAMMPRAGGMYVYLKEVYGPLWGFLYGWGAFAVINTGSIAAVAVTFAAYLGYFLPLNPVSIKIVAVSSVVLLTIINCFGIKAGAIVQNGFTLIKISALALLGLLSFILSNGTPGKFEPVLPNPEFFGLIGPLAIAMVAVLWSYDGWVEITYVAGEVKDPQRILPRSLFISTALVILLYILVNLSYMYLVPIGEIAHSSLVASEGATRIFGTTGASIISIVVIISTFGTNNGFIFASPRIYYAMAKEGLFFQWLAHVNPRFSTPIPSLIVQCILACLLIITGTFEQLTTYVIFASFLFYAMSAGGVLILRKRNPGIPRPYRTWGYPFTPILFILFSVYLVISSIMENPVDSLVGAGIIAVGIPAYLYWRKTSPR
jgi:APA family basic amino acid/polyamine antiporter